MNPSLAQARKMPNILNMAFDVELSEKIHEMLLARGVKAFSGTHPCLIASPAAYPLIKSSEMIAIEMLKNSRGV